MKNSYIEQIINDIQDGKDVSRIKRQLSYAYQQPMSTMYGMICWDNAIHTEEDAVALVQQLSLAGINELYITGGWSNQLDQWFAMDAFGMKLRGIVQIENADYQKEVEKWGDSDRPKTIAALRFSFKEE